MIEFNGEVSEACKKHIHKRVIGILCLSVLLIVIFLSALLIVAEILWDIWFFVIISIIIVVLIGVVFLLGNIRTINSKISTKVIIKDGFISISRENTYHNNTTITTEKFDTEKQRLFSKNIRTINLDIPTKLTAENDTMSDDKSCINRKISDVKKIIDMGSWYQMIFYFGYNSPYFACQKDLITSGTIEDFETLFKGKIEPAAKD